MVTLIVAAALSAQDFRSAYEQWAGIPLFTQRGGVLNNCDRAAEEMRIAGSLKTMLNNGYIVITDKRLLAQNGGSMKYVLNPDERRDLEGEVITFQTNADTDAMRCRSR